MVSKGDGEDDEGKPLSLSEIVDKFSRDACPPILHDEPKHRVKNCPPDENCTFINGTRDEGRGARNISAVKGEEDEQNQQANRFVNLRWVAGQSVNAEDWVMKPNAPRHRRWETVTTAVEKATNSPDGVTEG
jgi:hypothetical protein